jgi:uncharacterized membrane protein YccC
MPPYVKRIIVTAWAVVAAAAVIYFTYKSPNPMVRLVAIFGGFGFIFIFIKAYLFRS